MRSGIHITRLFVIAVALSVSHVGCASGSTLATGSQPLSDVFPGEHWEKHSNPEELGYSKAELDLVRGYVNTIATTGLVVAVDGKILFEQGDIEDLFYIASVRKSILVAHASMESSPPSGSNPNGRQQDCGSLAHSTVLLHHYLFTRDSCPD